MHLISQNDIKAIQKLIKNFVHTHKNIMICILDIGRPLKILFGLWETFWIQNLIDLLRIKCF